MTNTWNRINALLLLLVLCALLGVIAMLATGARGGPLDPVEPPASTMRSLGDIPPAWSQKLPANNGSPGGLFPTPPAGCNSTRFECVMDNLGVLDHETGLVWELNPEDSTMNWVLARGTCESGFIGERRGWRLPSMEEISTLADASAGAAPFVPVGHPFDVEIDEYYWTGTSTSATVARAAHFGNLGQGVFDKTTLRHVWCVRGGTGYES